MNLKELLKYSNEKAEEHIEYVQNEEFNTRLDDGDIDRYDLILRKPDGSEQSLSPISAALFVTDLPTYQQLAKDDLEQSRQEILNLEEYSTNRNAYDRLLSIIKHQATVIPFIGAGFSVAAGCPSWSDYIIKQAGLAGIDLDAATERLKDGQHEEMMDEVITRLTLDVFQRDFRSEFEGSRISPALSPSTELIGLFDRCAITTNFDRVLEESHRDKMPYDEKVVGKDNTGRFLKAVFRGEKYLLKLHGNIDDSRDRVLTQAEYNSGYGDGNIQENLPISRTLSRIFGSYTVLFLGCSLIADRYLTILKNVYEAGPTLMPEHFAILTAPEDNEERTERDQMLASHGITPIWFADGGWDRPADILKLLKIEQNL